MTRLRIPGEDLVDKGITDLRQQIVSIESLLVSMAPTALRDVGVEVPDPLPEPEVRLYQLLGEEHGNGAHSLYNAYRRRLVSYLRAARCDTTSTDSE